MSDTSISIDEYEPDTTFFDTYQHLVQLYVQISCDNRAKLLERNHTLPDHPFNCNLLEKFKQLGLQRGLVDPACLSDCISTIERSTEHNKEVIAKLLVHEPHNLRLMAFRQDLEQELFSIHVMLKPTDSRPVHLVTAQNCLDLVKEVWRVYISV